MLLPSVVSSALASAPSVGFCGSRSVAPPFSVFFSAAFAVPSSSVVSCGCVGGLCAVARAHFPAARVFRASSFGSGRSAFARRSVALVSSVAAVPGSVWLSFPAAPCPAGLVPSRSSSACFCGSGSGSWASLAFAVGSGVRCFVWLPASLSVPSSWGFVSLGGGWWSSGVVSLF